MTIEEILVAIQKFRSMLEVWGVSSLGLWVTGTVALLIFLFSIREVAVWFFKIGEVRFELRRMNEELFKLHDELLRLRTQSENPENLSQNSDGETIEPSPTEAKNDKNRGSRFRFDH